MDRSENHEIAMHNYLMCLSKVTMPSGSSATELAELPKEHGVRFL